MLSTVLVLVFVDGIAYGPLLSRARRVLEELVQTALRETQEAGEKRGGFDPSFALRGLTNFKFPAESSVRGKLDFVVVRAEKG